MTERSGFVQELNGRGGNANVQGIHLRLNTHIRLADVVIAMAYLLGRRALDRL
ncbi:hypothetical protein SSE37_00395 [Sagittula stellata E-37]|uniref:Uncharacterized protein n=1 Tax=Sagittula stellata (strain ATCC 700073 / DSM 11524 / E-37) TaxID=388399 RepID=A3K7C5_SAGS3|nr:hypothetical protein SSE37_00395 [Sagittula stellata E-37]